MKRYMIATEFREVYNFSSALYFELRGFNNHKLGGKGYGHYDVYEVFDWLLRGCYKCRLTPNTIEKIGKYASELPKGWRKEYYTGIFKHELPHLSDAQIDNLVERAMAVIEDVIAIPSPSREEVSDELMAMRTKLDTMSNELTIVLTNPNVSDLTMELSEALRCVVAAHDALSDAKARADV